jgi:TldD protein
MLDEDFLLKVIKKTQSNGGEYADVFVEHRKQTSLVIEDGNLEKIITGIDSGAGTRLISSNKTAYAFCNELSENSLMRAASATCKTAKSKSAPQLIELTTKNPLIDFHIDLLPDDVPLERKISAMRSADLTARSLDNRIKQVTVIYRDAVQRVQIATSDGFIVRDERIYTTAVIQVIAVYNDVIQTGYESVGGLMGFELLKENSIEELSATAAKRALMMLTASRAPGGRMPVVISSRAGGTMIHEAIGHGLEADLIQQGLSVFSDRLHRKVASSLVTVIDDSTIAHKRGSFRFDDEGTPSERTLLVENGILKGYMFDRLSAMKSGTRSTGNGRRQSYKHRPIPRMTNTYIQEGSTPPDQIVSSLEKGLLVEKMGGGQVNTVTGDFVFDVQEGYLIEKGKKGEPVRGATLTGNGPQILSSIDMMGSDLGFSIGTCGKDSQGVPVTDGMPTIRIPEIVVGGAHGQSG